MWPLAHKFRPITLHAAKERTHDLHIEVLPRHLWPLALLITIVLWHLPAAEGRDAVVVRCVFDDQVAIGRVVETEVEGVPPPLPLVGGVGDEVAPEGCVET